VVVLDWAGWHAVKDRPLPEGVHLALQPTAFQELQPAERL
jgi:hypothetical protein